MDQPPKPPPTSSCSTSRKLSTSSNKSSNDPMSNGDPPLVPQASCQKINTLPGPSTTGNLTSLSSAGSSNVDGQESSGSVSSVPASTQKVSISSTATSPLLQRKQLNNKLQKSWDNSVRNNNNPQRQLSGSSKKSSVGSMFFGGSGSKFSKNYHSNAGTTACGSSSTFYTYFNDTCGIGEVKDDRSPTFELTKNDLNSSGSDESISQPANLPGSSSSSCSSMLKDVNVKNAFNNSMMKLKNHCSNYKINSSSASSPGTDPLDCCLVHNYCNQHQTINVCNPDNPTVADSPSPIISCRQHKNATSQPPFDDQFAMSSVRATTIISSHVNSDNQSASGQSPPISHHQNAALTTLTYSLSNKASVSSVNLTEANNDSVK